MQIENYKSKGTDLWVWIISRIIKVVRRNLKERGSGMILERHVSNIEKEGERRK